MKPGFALSLSFEGISLLHRAAGGWRSVGEVALDVADMGADLAAVRARALALEPDGVWCKIILPNDQIRYLSVDTGTFNGDARMAMVRSALEDATPYPVDDLVFDVSADGAITHVAAAARDTLAEAEAFAAEHGFNPVSFVAVPGDNPFLGEPFFGPAGSLAGLPAGEEVEPDGIAVVVIGPAELPAAQPAPEPEPDQIPRPPLKLIPEPGIDADTPDESLTEPDLTPEPAAEPEPAATPAPAPGFSSRRRRSSDSSPAPSLGGAKRDASPPPATPVSPVASKVAPDTAPDIAAAPSGSDYPEQPVSAPPAPDTPPALSEPPLVSVTSPTLELGDFAEPETATDPEPAPAGGIGGFLSRRRKADREQPETSAPPQPAVTPVSRPTAQTAFANGAGVPPPEDEAARMTVFGARQSAQVGGKPRFLGLILMAGLLLFLAAIAVWASLFLDDGLAGLFRRGPDDTELVAVPNTPTILSSARTAAPQTQQQAPTPPTQPVASPPTPDTSTTFAALPPTGVETSPLPGTLQSALPDQPVQPIPPPAEPPTQPDTAADLTATDTAVLDALRRPDTTQPDATQPDPGQPDPATTLTPPDLTGAAARYAATGIWPTAPQVPEAPAIIGLDDLYVASIDRTDLGQDAVALPPATGLGTDRLPGAVSSPVAAGTNFDLDARGLVVATAAGALSPDGVMIYLGRPSIVPPFTPTRFETRPEVDALQDRLAGLRPRLRPGDLSDQFERNTLGGLTRDELGGLRPKARPRTLKQESEQDETPTAQAVAASRLPKPRPSNFQATVSAAVRPATGATGATTGGGGADGQQVASIAPRTVTPKIPSSTSVARQATVNNAINLRQVNLIGVYGTPSSRRALVRLPSGRYKKVKVGDTVDGGRVVAIGDSELRYQKGGRNLTLKIPSG